MGNTTVCECIIISCAVSLFGVRVFGKNGDIFMAVICDMAKERLADRRYFFELRSFMIK